MDPQKKRRPCLLIALCLALLLSALPASAVPERSAAAPQGTAVGYYAGWASAQGYTPQRIPAQRLTHINYAFAGIDGDSRLALSNPAQDRNNLAQLVRLREEHPHLKLLISVGGWDGSANFSDAASTAARRQAFAQSCAAFLAEHRLDGVDLDWEYPVSGGTPGTGHRPEDRENFTLLLRELREQLDRQGQKDGKTYLLTIAAAPDAGYLNKIQPLPVSRLVDHIFLMAYDLHGPWDTYADFNAPLYAPSEPSPQYKTSVSDGVKLWLDRGVPGDKLVLGIPLYGYCYQGVTGGNNGLYGTFSSSLALSYDQVVRDFLSDSAYRALRHSQAQTPYLYGRRSFLTYEDPESAAAKGGLARELGLAGVGFWELSQDREAALISSACSAFSVRGFSDVSPRSWYAQAVDFVCGQGWMSGTSDSAFSPELTVTRGMFVTVLHRMSGSPAARTGRFPDLPQQHYAAQAAAWAAQQGLAAGYADGRFGPDDPVTREQMALMLFRFARLRGLSTRPRDSLRSFRDASAVSPYALEAVQWAAAAGLLSGRASGRLDPSGPASRAETAAILMAFSKLS